jgi:hypothetical protein
MTWLAISETLTAAVAWRAWPEAPWLPRLIVLDAVARPDARFPSGGPRRLQAYRDAEAPHVERIESAIEQYLKNGWLPKIGNEATSYFLSLRFHAVSLHLESWAPVLDRVLANPEPSQVAAVLRERLIDDWRNYGPNWGVGFSYVEHDFDEDGS